MSDFRPLIPAHAGIQRKDWPQATVLNKMFVTWLGDQDGRASGPAFHRWILACAGMSGDADEPISGPKPDLLAFLWTSGGSSAYLSRPESRL